MRVEITFGALAKPLREQLALQCLSPNNGVVRHWQRDADAISRLSVRGLLTEAGTSQARRRLLKNIIHYSRKEGS